MSRIICRLSSWLPESTPLLSRVFDRHRETCLRCQADVARLRGVSRDLSVLEDEVVPAPGGLHTQVMATLPEQDAADPRRPLVVRLVARWVTGIGVAVATLVAIITRQARKRA
jgi:anti-sigma factor RsiW